jgi:RND superfamily putative drug exporter
MSNSPLHKVVVSLTRFSARHRRTVVAAWIVFVVGCVFAGHMAAARSSSNASQSATGSAGRGLAAVLQAGLGEPASESVLVQGRSPAAVRRASAALYRQLDKLPQVSEIRSPTHHPALVAHGGRDELTELVLDNGPTSSVVGVQAAVKAVARANRSLRLYEIGDGSIESAINNGVDNDFHRAELFALPLTLVILVAVFGAIAAAFVPLLLGLTSVAAALGLVGALSSVVPTDSTASSVILLLGLAVGVDYSLFYMRRNEEGRRDGLEPREALEATSRTVGHAVVVSGACVIVAMAGLLLTGTSTFTAVAVGTMLVVAIAVLGSLTVLPAVLALLGHRLDWGRVRRRRPAGQGGRGNRFWVRLANSVVARPKLALATVVAALGALSFGVLSLHTSDVGLGDVPKDAPVMSAQHAIERVFPGGSDTAEIVISDPDRRFSTASDRAALRRLGDQATAATHAAGIAAVEVSRSGRVAEVIVPLPGTGIDARTMSALATLRSRVEPAARREFPGSQVDLTGHAAAGDDFNSLMQSRAPLVIGFVLVLGFLLLLAAFRSVSIAAAVLALNLLSVGAAFGAMVAIFQHTWAQGLLGFTSDGAVVSWLPLFAFAVLFGLSMDYTVLVVSRILEGIHRGLGSREAVAEAVAATAGVVSSAAIVMVAVFSVFATLSALEYKQAGVGLATAILIDATLVRGVALPAAITLLADRRQRRAAATPSTSRTQDALPTGF